MTEEYTHKSILDREVVLANGARVPLLPAVCCYGEIEALLRGDLGYKVNPVPLLRRFCLDLPLKPKQSEFLQKYFLDEDGAIDPIMREVILASVRGDELNLTVTSPFITALDRGVSEFINARHLIRTTLSQHEANLFILEEPVEDAMSLLRRGGKDQEYHLDDAETFLKKALGERDDVPESKPETDKESGWTQREQERNKDKPDTLPPL